MNIQIINILISVFAGILTYIIIGIIKKIFHVIILPWYQAQMYKGLDISGKWVENHDYEGLFIQESKIKIEQRAHKINGTITLAKKKDNNEVIEIKNFRFEGEFYNNFLNITCWNENRQQIGTHNYLMSIERDGKEIQGFKTYFDIGIRKIRTEEIYWFRK